MSSIRRLVPGTLWLVCFAACGDEPGPIPVAPDGAHDGAVEPCAAAGVDGESAPHTDPAAGLLIDDFDQARATPVCVASGSSWADPLVNLLGYCNECFSDCSGSQGGQLNARVVTDPQRTLRCRGGSLELEFDVSQSATMCNPPPMPRAFAGFAEVLVGNELCPTDRGSFNLEALQVDHLTFWVAAASGSEDWDLEVAIEDIERHQSPKLRVRAGLYLDQTVYAGGWQKARIPINDFLTSAEPPNLRELREINFTLTAGVTHIDRGRIYLDEVALTRTPG
jgi:hypothetical protein